MLLPQVGTGDLLTLVQRSQSLWLYGSPKVVLSLSRQAVLNSAAQRHSKNHGMRQFSRCLERSSKAAAKGRQLGIMQAVAIEIKYSLIYQWYSGKCANGMTAELLKLPPCYGVSGFLMAFKTAKLLARYSESRNFKTRKKFIAAGEHGSRNRLYFPVRGT